MDEFIIPPIARYIDKYHLTGKFFMFSGTEHYQASYGLKG